MRLVILFLFSLLLFSACKEKAELQNDVIAIHDEIMPKMGDIHMAKKQLKKLLTKTESDSIKTQIFGLISNLEKADEGMMDWMNNWDVPKQEPEMTEYLLSEKKKITKVKEEMLSSIDAANQFLSKKEE